jgi:hypothetical protein
VVAAVGTRTFAARIDSPKSRQSDETDAPNVRWNANVPRNGNHAALRSASRSSESGPNRSAR